MITLILTLTLTVALTVAYWVWVERNRRAEYARLAARRTAMRTTTTTTPVDTRPLKGRRAGAAHPTDAPRVAPGKHAATGRHAAPVAPAPVMVAPTASGRVRSVHTGKLVSAYVAGVLTLPLPHYATVPPVPSAAPRHNRPTRANARPVVSPWLTVA